MVSIHGPRGYEPRALPLSYFADASVGKALIHKHCPEAASLCQKRAPARLCLGPPFRSSSRALETTDAARLALPAALSGSRPTVMLFSQIMLN